jgi:hypothetical protein
MGIEEGVQELQNGEMEKVGIGGGFYLKIRSAGVGGSMA